MKFIRPSQRDMNNAIEFTTNSCLSTLIGEIHYADALIIAHAKNTEIKNVNSENHAVKKGNLRVESMDDFVNILEEYQNETKRKYSTHFVQKLIKELEVK